MQTFHKIDSRTVGQLFVNCGRSSRPGKLDIRRRDPGRPRPPTYSIVAISVRFHSLNGVPRRPEFKRHVAPYLAAFVVCLSIIRPTPLADVGTRHGARVHCHSSPIQLHSPPRADDRIIGSNAASRSWCLMGLFILPQSRSGNSQPIKRASFAISAYSFHARTHAHTLSDDASPHVGALIAFFFPFGVIYQVVCGPL